MKIEKERMTIEDTMDRIVETEKGITCGCDKPSLRMEMHLDGTDYYQSNYVCQCGNQIVMVVERDEASKMLWK